MSTNHIIDVLASNSYFLDYRNNNDTDIYDNNMLLTTNSYWLPQYSNSENISQSIDNYYEYEINKTNRISNNNDNFSSNDPINDLYNCDLFSGFEGKFIKSSLFEKPLSQMSFYKNDLAFNEINDYNNCYDYNNFNLLKPKNVVDMAFTCNNYDIKSTLSNIDNYLIQNASNQLSDIKNLENLASSHDNSQNNNQMLNLVESSSNTTNSTQKSSIKSLSTYEIVNIKGKRNNNKNTKDKNLKTFGKVNNKNNKKNSLFSESKKLNNLRLLKQLKQQRIGV